MNVIKTMNPRQDFCHNSKIGKLLTSKSQRVFTTGWYLTER